MSRREHRRLLIGLLTVWAMACGGTDGGDAKPAPADPSQSAKGEEPSPSKEAPPDPEPAADESDGQPAGTVHGEAFSTRGILAHRLRDSDPTIEIRLFSRAASCDSFDADYKSRDGEPIVIINLQWPRSKGDGVSFGAKSLDERLQFCRGKEGRGGRARCEPRAQDQGSLTVVEASPETGVLSLDLKSPEGTLSGPLAFTVCPRK